MLRDAVPKIRSLGPSFHNCDSRLQVECRYLVGHVGYEQQDSEEEGHLCLQPLKGRLTFTILPRPTLLTMHYFLIVARSHSFCVVWRHFQWSPILVPFPPMIPQKLPCTCLSTVACCPLAGWWATTCRAQVCLSALPAQHHTTSPTLGAQTGPRASGGSPQHPPRCHPDAKIIFQVSVLTLITVQRGRLMGQNSFSHLRKRSSRLIIALHSQFMKPFLGLSLKNSLAQEKKGVKYYLFMNFHTAFLLKYAVNDQGFPVYRATVAHTVYVNNWDLFLFVV